MDHGQGQSTGAPAPSVEDRISSLAQGMLTESTDNPNAWEEEKPEQSGDEPAEEAEASEAPPEPEAPAEEATEVTEDLEEIEYSDGKTYKVPKELKRGWLREEDYTRKTQKVAESYRQVDATLNQLSQTAQVIQAVAPKIGELRNLDARIQQIMAYAPQIQATDPVAYGAFGTELNILQAQRNQLSQELSGEESKVVHALDQARQQTIRARMESEMPKLLEDIADFNPAKHGKEASEYLQKRGYSSEAATYINQSPLALADILAAMKWRQLQSDKKTSLKKVQALPPVAKPGQRTSTGDVELKKLSDLNRKSGGKDPDVRRALLRKQLFGR